MLEEKQNELICADYLRNLKDAKELRSGRLSDMQVTHIRDRVMSLPREERLVVYLHFWEQSTIREIGETLELPTDLVSKILHNALARLRADLQGVIKGPGDICDVIKLEVAA